MSTNDIEVWKKIPNYERYLISNFGRLKSEDAYVKRKDGSRHLRKGQFANLKSVNTGGYFQTVLTDSNGVRKSKIIHRLVAQAFIDNPLNLSFINHKDGNKLNNHYSNLEWCTPQENIAHAVKTGLMKRGQQLDYSKLVLDTETGIFYESILEVSIFSGVNYKTLNHWLNGTRKNRSSFILV